MKKKLFYFLAVLLVLISGVMLVGCDIFADIGDNGGEIPVIDNTVDLEVYTPEVGDNLPDGEVFYKSVSVDLVTEIHGNYRTDRPFTLDSENENKRIYRNIYFYEDDFFQVLYYKDPNDLGALFAIMSDESDSEYAEVEYDYGNNPLQITIKKQGIYDLVLDVETFGIDMVKVGDIDTPVYEQIKTCELYVHLSASNASYTPMTLDESTNEYYIEKDVPMNASIGFFNASHTARYKMDVEASLKNTLVYRNDNNVEKVQVHVGGRYKIYFNAKTYVLRLELQNPDTASYFCQVGWQEGKELSPVSSSTPYLFEYEFVAERNEYGVFVDLPSFYPSLGMPYDLTIVNENGEEIAWYVEEGTYMLRIDLKDFKLTVTRKA